MTQYGTELLETYKNALAKFKANDFKCTDLAALIVRAEGREGRLAVNQARRENFANRGANPDSQEVRNVKVQRMLFPKKNETLEESNLPGFTLKIKGKAQQPESQPENQRPTQPAVTQPESQPQPQRKPQPIPPPGIQAEKSEPVAADETGQDTLPVTPDEIELLKQMKPAAIGRTFGLERIRGIATRMGINWKDEHSATVIGGAILNFLKKQEKQQEK